MNRSDVMARVKGADTKPELLVRRLLTRLGYRYRLHRKEIPGKPDIAFVGRRKAIFVHGCFWHGHHCPRGARMPATNTDYWVTKIARNRERDARVQKQLAALGWSSLTLWECELRDDSTLVDRIAAFVGPPKIGVRPAP